MADRPSPGQPSERLSTVIVGGGVSGLTVAETLTRQGRSFVLLEASGRLGGNIRTESHDGYLYDAGPDSFLATKPHGRALAERLGLASELIRPLSSGSLVFVAFDGRLHPMPEGLALGFPTRLGALLDSSLLSGEGKLRAMLEPLVPRRPEGTGEESILSFCERRVGREMATRVVAPLLSGVFAGDAERLGIEACFPQLVEFERSAGSLLLGSTHQTSIYGALTRQKKAHPSPFLGLRRGLGSLVDALVARLPASAVRREARVVRLEPSGAEVVVVLDTGERLRTGSLVLAGPPWAAAPLLESVDRELGAELGAVRGSPTATVFFGLDESALGRPLEGSGFIVPKGEGEILASTWTSSKWEGRAPRGKALVRAFLGGARGDGLGKRTDEELVLVARSELERFMGPLGKVEFSRVFRYERGTPQPDVGHVARLGRIGALRKRHVWLDLIGSGYGGVGIPDCIRQAEEVAERILRS